MRGWLAAALILSLALAGCAAKNDTTSTTTTTHSVATTAATNTTAQNTTKVQHAPTANLTATPLGGDVPLNVTFQLSGADVDGDLLNWTLAFGDGNQTAGSALPANGTSVLHAYHVGGNLTAILTVTDGTGNATASVLVRLTLLPTGPNICNVVPDQTVGPLYYTSAAGGNWVFRESNGIAGLQVGNTSVTGPDGGGVGESSDDWKTCVDADTLVF